MPSHHLLATFHDLLAYLCLMPAHHLLKRDGILLEQALLRGRWYRPRKRHLRKTLWSEATPEGRW